MPCQFGTINETIGEMIIHSPTEPRIVDDYNIVFLNGIDWPITIDKQSGDEIDFQQDRIVIKFGHRSSVVDESIRTPSEDQTIYLNNVIIVRHIQRTFIPQTKEQKDELKQLLKTKTAKTIH